MWKRIVTVDELAAALPEQLRAVEAGDRILITRNGEAVAVLAPPEDADRRALLPAAGAERGLVSLAGGWEGADEFVRIVEDSRRR